MTSSPGKVFSNAKRLPSLDGLRAISVSLVLVGHLNGAPNIGYLPSWLGDVGLLGVRVFFVISGFLITHLLLNEESLYGRISLRNFYARRAIRILPVVFAFVGVAVLAGHSLAEAFPTLTFTANYVRTGWTFAHFWSLSVEEQFYLVWPFVLVALPRRRIPILVAVILLCPVLRVLHYIRIGDDGFTHFELVCDALAFGCLLACARGSLQLNSLYRKAIASRPLASGAAILAWAANTTSSHPRFYQGVATSVSILAIGFLIVHCVEHPPRLLNGPILTWLGTLSYSLYVWQQLFLRQFRAGTWINAFPWCVLLALTAAAASYYLLEKPALRLRKRMRVPSPAPALTPVLETAAPLSTNSYS